MHSLIDWFEGILFGGLMVLTAAVGAIGAAWMIVEGCTKAMPQIVNSIHSALKLPAYREPVIKRRRQILQTDPLPPKAPVPPDFAFGNIRSYGGVREQRRAYSDDFLPNTPRMFTPDVIKHIPQIAKGGNVRYMHEKEQCSLCGNHRRVFHVALNVCYNCARSMDRRSKPEQVEGGAA